MCVSCVFKLLQGTMLHRQGSSLLKKSELGEFLRTEQAVQIASGAIVMFHIYSEGRETYMPHIGELETGNKLEFLQKFMNSDQDMLVIYRVS